MLDFSEENCLEMISAWFQFADGWDKYFLETLGAFLEKKVFEEGRKAPFMLKNTDFPEASPAKASKFIAEWNDFQNKWEDYIPFLIPFAKGDNKKDEETARWFKSARDITGTNIGGNLIEGRRQPDWIDRAREVGLDFYYLDGPKTDSSLVMFSYGGEEDNERIKMTFSLAKRLIVRMERKKEE